MDGQIGNKIKNYLENRGITQTFIAKKTGISINKLNMSLNGNRKLLAEEYFLICEALGVPLNTFYEKGGVAVGQ